MEKIILSLVIFGFFIGCVNDDIKQPSIQHQEMKAQKAWSELNEINDNDNSIKKK